MKPIIFIMAVLLGISANGYSQAQPVDKKAARDEMRAQRAEERKVKEQLMAEVVDSMLHSRKFVLEANYLSNQHGNRTIVSSNLNFIMVDSNEVVIQIGSNNSVGSNGVGGITTTGRITTYDLKKVGKNQGYYVLKMSAMTPIGMYDIWMQINPNSNTDASISGINYGKLNYHGVIRTFEDSKVWKGRSI